MSKESNWSDGSKGSYVQIGHIDQIDQSLCFEPDMIHSYKYIVR